MGIRQANKSLRFIFILLCGIVLGYIVMFEPLYAMINHSPLVNMTIVGVQIIGLIYTLFAYLSLCRGVKDWTRFERQLMTDIKEIDEVKLGGATRMLSHRLSELLYSKNEARSALLQALHDSFNRKSDAAGYISGLLVSLGLLGTFIGLTQTMGDIKSAVDIAIDGGGSDVKTLLGGIAAPLGGMSAAFGASLLGLLGSIIMGLAAHLLSSASEGLYEEIDEWTFAHYRPEESVIGILNGNGFAEGNGEGGQISSSGLVSGQISIDSTSGGSLLGSQVVHLLNCIYSHHQSTQAQSVEQMAIFNASLQVLLSHQETLINQQQYNAQLQSELLAKQDGIVNAIEQQHEYQQSTFNMFTNAQYETNSLLDRLTQFTHDTLMALQSLEEKQVSHLSGLHAELESVNTKLVEKNKQHDDAVLHYENVRNLFERSLQTLSENIAFLHENKVATSNVFEQVSSSLMSLKSETQGVRSQLLTIDSELRERTNSSSLILDSFKAQNNTLLACLAEMTQARMAMLSQHIVEPNIDNENRVTDEE